MKHLKLDGEAFARVWLDDLPPASYTASSVLVQTLTATEGTEHRRVVAAVELFRPLGGRFAYGMLGGCLVGDKSAKLVLEVNIAGMPAGNFDGGFSSDLDDVHVGLPSEFAPSVMAGLQRGAAEVRPLAGGRLTVGCAAYGEIGSSPAVFELLGSALIKLLNRSEEQPSEAELIQMFRS